MVIERILKGKAMHTTMSHNVHVPGIKEFLGLKGSQSPEGPQLLETWSLSPVPKCSLSGHLHRGFTGVGFRVINPALPKAPVSGLRLRVQRLGPVSYEPQTIKPQQSPSSHKVDTKGKNLQYNWKPQTRKGLWGAWLSSPYLI